MGGRFTIVQVRAMLTAQDAAGWYEHPAGTVAEVATDTDLARDGITILGDDMTRSFRSFVFAAALAACGSRSPAPTTTPSEPAPAPATSAASNEATPATQPETPAPPATAEPAKPEPVPPDPKAELLAAENAAWDSAKPSFTKYCASCHTKAGKKAAKKKLDHFAMDTYPLGGHHAATIGFTIRDVLGLSGKKASMPSDRPGAVKGDELAAIKAWTDAWEAAEKAGAHPGGVHAPAKDDD